MPVRSKRTYPIVFGIILAVVCSLILKTLDAALVGRIERNRSYDRKKNVALVLVGREKFAQMTRDQIESMYKKEVEEVRQGAGADSPIAYYCYIDPATKKRLAYVIPLEGMGLWDKVKGLMSVETDLDTIRAVSFYDQAETPGLGGRIGEASWASRFDGKKLKDAAGAVAITITKAGSAAKGNANEVDGITAATLTCRAVNKLVQQDVKRFLEQVKK